MKLADLTVNGFVEELASDSPAPCGGSAAALEGALGAALVGITDLGLPAIVHVHLAVLAGFLFGAAYAAIIGGLYGVAAGLCLFVWYLCTIDSYGRNYTAPWSGGRPDNLSQTFLRKPPSADKLRETELNCPDRRKRS